MTIRDVVDARRALREQRPQELIGLCECDWLDVKSGAYHLDNPAHVQELAKDVAAFANSSGGLLLIGYKTRLENSREFLDELRPVPADRVDIPRYRDVLRARITPAVSGLHIEWHDQGGSKGVLEICIPAQPSAAKPYLVAGPRSTENNLSISVPIREGDGTRWLPQTEVQHLMAAGRAATRQPEQDPTDIRVPRSGGQERDRGNRRLVAVAGAIIAQASRTTRTVLQHRRISTAGSIAALIAVGAILAIPSSLSGRRLNAGLIVTPEPTASVTASPSSDTDPLRVDATFGWLPFSGSDVSYANDAEAPFTEIARGGGATNSPGLLRDGGAQVLTLSTTDLEPTAPYVNSLVRIDTPNINGRTAFWLSFSVAAPIIYGNTELVWQLSNGRWATLDASGIGGTSAEDTLRHVAATVHPGTYAAPVPIRISNLPPSTTTVAIDLQQPPLKTETPDYRSIPWYFDVDLSIDNTEIYISVIPQPGKAAAPHGFGTPAPTCAVRSGLQVCVSILGAVPLELTGGQAGLLSNITSFGQDPQNWTTNFATYR